MLAQFRKWMKKEQGFTLIELMVVIVILGVLAGIGIPQYTNFVNRAYRAELEVARRQLQLGMQLYRLDKNSYPGVIEIDGESVPDFDGSDALAVNAPARVGFYETTGTVTELAHRNSDYITDWPANVLVEDYEATGGSFTLVYKGRPEITLP